MRRIVRCLVARGIVGAAALAGGVALGSPARGVALTYSGSLSAASGEYLSTERTRSIYFYNGIGVARGRWRLSIGLPLVAQSSPLLHAGGSAVPRADGGSASGGAGSGDPEGHDGHHGAGTAETIPEDHHAIEFGLGDPVVRADFPLHVESRRAPSLRVAMQVKAPLGSQGDHGVGTGEWDYGAGLSLAKWLGGGSLLVDAGYWVLGDPDDLELENAVAYGVSYGRPLGARLALLGSLIGYSRLIAGTPPPAQAGLLLSWWLRPERSLSAGVALGLTDSAPDMAFSVGWRLGR